MISTEELQSLVFCLGTGLSQLESDALRLYLEGSSYEEMAEELGCDTKTIDNALQRVKRKILQHQASRQVLQYAYGVQSRMRTCPMRYLARRMPCVWRLRRILERYPASSAEARRSGTRYDHRLFRGSRRRRSQPHRGSRVARPYGFGWWAYVLHDWKWIGAVLDSRPVLHWTRRVARCTSMTRSQRVVLAEWQKNSIPADCSASMMASVDRSPIRFWMLHVARLANASAGPWPLEGMARVA